jgi:hypothetical protein
VQYAPYKLKEGTWDEKREEFGDTVIDTIAEHAPNIKDIILHRQVLTPLDLEREFGLSEGNIEVQSRGFLKDAVDQFIENDVVDLVSICLIRYFATDAEFFQHFWIDWPFH